MRFEEWFFLIVIWHVVGVRFILCMMDLHMVKFNIFTPKCIYEVINVNRFGCAVLTVVFNLSCPILSICYWFYVLCTIGRK